MTGNGQTRCVERQKNWTKEIKNYIRQKSKNVSEKRGNLVQSEQKMGVNGKTTNKRQREGMCERST